MEAEAAMTYVIGEPASTALTGPLPRSVWPTAADRRPGRRLPKAQRLSYWAFLFGGLIVISGFVTPGGAADFGWFAYTPLSDAAHSPGVGGDQWIMGLVLAGLGTILGAVNMITTVVCLRALGMMERVPQLPLWRDCHRR